MVVCAANIDEVPDYAVTWPGEFQRSFLGVLVWQWVLLGLIVVVSGLAGLIAWRIARRLTYWRDRVVSVGMSDLTRNALARAAGFLTSVLLARALFPSLRLPDKVVLASGHRVAGLGLQLQTLINALIVLALTMLAFALWDVSCDLIANRAVGHERAERLLVPMMRKFVRAVIVICGILFVLGTVFGTQTLTGLVAGLGVTGLVVALAGKDSVENLFGSLTILFDMPFALGDYVKIDKVEGVVEEINLRSTRIRTVEDTLITLPNANLIRAAVENFGARRTRRQRLLVRLSYTTDAEGAHEFCTAIRHYIDGHEDVVKEKTIVQLDDPTETSLGVLIIWYLHANSVLEESESKARVLSEVLRHKRSKGLLLASVPAEEAPKP